MTDQLGSVKFCCFTNFCSHLDFLDHFQDFGLNVSLKNIKNVHSRLVIQEVTFNRHRSVACNPREQVPNLIL